MHVWNVRHAACWKCRTQKVAKNRHLGTIAQLCQAIPSQPRHLSTIRKKLVKQLYVLQMSPQYGEHRPTNGWEWLAGLGHFIIFQQVSCLGSITARQSSSGRQPNCGAEQRAPPMFGRATITLGLAHILVLHYFAKFVYSVVVKQLLGLPRFQPVTILIRSVQLFSDCLGETREGNMLYFRL